MVQVKIKEGMNKESSNGVEYSFWRDKLSSLAKHKMATIAAVIILALYLMVILAGFLAPYHPNQAFKNHFFHPPTKIHIKDANGLTWPYVYATKATGWAKYQEDKSKKYPIKLLYQDSEYRFLKLIPTTIHLVGVDEPAHLFLMGTDNYGRDIFTRILFGGRVSMFLGFAGILITSIFGLLIGGVAGYYGGWIDSLLMRIVEVILSIPSFYLLLALAAVLPIKLSSAFRFFLIILILSFIGWAGMARVIRGMVMSIKDQDYVVAAKSLGASDLRIIWKHILPTATTYVIVRATLAIPGYILMESGLSFIGLGIQQPDASWGNMLSSAQSITKITSFPWLLIPGLMIFIAILSFNLLGDGVRDALDPKNE
ncbi:peptide/nickel transport system permease protein [Orenia metallireducens]|uniref:Peptide/nickel transport system permease protein n=1 Tax=Orenia metallireducens TaxID=1413210 RepID=A0A285HSL9_9FIRM|nr:ABC transporter permease [Orenia metallireducens]PRX24051.1 peptide/nickel transport system permease protein [Orenia metallireducens]SNY38710.1 peptide/nickel transport system permease protein [Orenia metallireducens]